MNNGSIIKHLISLLTDQGYEVVISPHSNSASIERFPTAMVGPPQIIECKIEPQGFAKQYIKILLLENTDAKEPLAFSQIWETMEQKVIELCNKLVDNQQIVEINLKESTPSYAKYTTMNETALAVKLEMITIY